MEQDFVKELDRYQERINDRYKLYGSLLKDLKGLQKLLNEPVENAFEISGKVAAISEKAGRDDEIKGIRKVLSDVHAECRKWRDEMTVRFGRRLKEMFEEEGLDLEVRGTEYRHGPFVIKADFGAGKAEIQFARETMASGIGLKPKQILKKLKSVQKDLTGRRWDAEDYIKTLFEAYRRTILLNRREPGARAGIIDVLKEMSFLTQRPAFNKNPSKRNYRGYGRSYFSYDLNRLRRENVLSTNGFRLNLGTATIDYTRDARKSLYLTDGRGGGNYIMYLSFIKSKES